MTMYICQTLIKVIPCEDADANDHKVAAFVLKYAVKDLRYVIQSCSSFCGHQQRFSQENSGEVCERTQ